MSRSQHLAIPRAASTLRAMPDADTVVFIPAWNEERALPGVLDELRAGLPDADVLVIDDGSTDATAEVAAADGAIVVSFGENRGLRAGIAAGYREAHERGYAYCGRVDADGQHPVDELRTAARARPLGRLRRRRRLALRRGRGVRRRPLRALTRTRRFGIGLLQKAMHVRLGRPFHDPTSGMAAVNREAMPVMARPYASGAPEVEALLAAEAGRARVDEVAVHMREREHGESKLQGKKAVKLVLTVVGTLLFFRWLRHRRS